ncbi:hypothetical protein KVR01_005193 [Diaporthe batatas]|uniref:uncharacterized protein n=1 Tax=Diaporthe batatas TaxID=748121 RepID=UPI001D038139|nr:uncharacterized protein KVR01_005193 [Diaporthe batatas]KAG8164918.1 hypothetical protein KVR01_005193 [Diaporthe batatas]
MLNSPSADELVGAWLIVDVAEGDVIGAGVSGGVGSWARASRISTSTRAAQGLGGDSGCWRTRPEKIAVSSAPRGSQATVVTRRWNHTQSKEVVQVPGASGDGRGPGRTWQQM